MKYTPHKYQEFATNFILEHPIAAVFLDCGMGKTSLTLLAILLLMYDRFEAERVLIIAPLRVAKHTWKDEIEKWDDFSYLKYAVAVGTPAERTAALKSDAKVVFINRENIAKRRVPLVPWQPLFQAEPVRISNIPDTLYAWSAFPSWKGGKAA